ncbi:LysR family transcriptional regulator [Microbacterium sp. No. 7]|uniref:LysR family transcriptional regulator n=1 Tax=Microbacterium sp. No. 7 TaxID=1714373 RepID=UPI000AEAB100|nr:LysR family transcriptional regulator [Microbacterium sp. No. 7]
MDLSRIDLNLLVALDALLAERNVTRAASRLYVGQSTMSATLGRLRQLLGDPILVREGRELVATPFAESLAAPLGEVLAQLSQLVSQRPGFDEKTSSRAFRIMATEYSTTIFLQPLLTRFAHEAPHVELRFSTLSQDYADQMRRGEVDLLVYPLESLQDSDRFENAALFRDRYVLLADEANEAVKDKATVEQLSTLPYLAMTFDGRPSYVDIQLQELGIQTNRLVVAAGALGPFLIRGTDVITITHESLARFAAEETGTLRVLDLPVELAPMTESMVWLPRYTRDPAHEWLRRTIVDAVEQYGRGRWGRDMTAPNAD